MIGLNNRLSFGKYQGKLLRWIIDNDPEYILWCLENIKTFGIDTEADDALEWAMADIWDE